MPYTRKYWDIYENATLTHKNDYLLLSVRWTDNYQLDYATLSTNATSSGTWQNVSGIGLSGTEYWANFTYQIPSGLTPGYYAWMQYGNDSFNNQNSTPVTSPRTIEIWGWSDVSQSYLTDDYIYVDNETTMMCRITDAANSSGIENYVVYFYNSTEELGTNLTNATGWTQFTFSDPSAGNENIICNITDNSTMMYNTSVSEGSDLLHTSLPGGDITPLLPLLPVPI